MTRAEKISKIKDLAKKSGFIPLPYPVKINGTDCHIVNEHGIMRNICGDWCVEAMFEGAYYDGEISMPELTDNEVDTIYNAVQDYCFNILFGMAR